MAINFPSTPALNDTHIVGNVTWTFDGVAWSILSTSGGGGGVGGGISTVSGDTGTISGQSTLTIAGGTDISTEADGTTVTVNYTGAGGGGGGGGASALGDLTDVNLTTVNENEVLKYVGGEWTNATDDTGDGGGGGGAGNYADLGDIPVGHTPAEFYESAIVTLRVNNNGTSAYTFNSHYSGDNPTIYAISGTTIAFDLTDIGGHPFLLQDSLGTNLTSGLVHISADGTSSFNANAQGKDSGVLYWRIEEAIASPPNYRYQCSVHAAMVGPITIKDLSTF